MWRSLASKRGCTGRYFGIYSGSGNPVNLFMHKAVSSMTHTRRPAYARYDAFLRRLRAGGRSNMYGAIPYLMARFELDRDSAFRIVCDWVDRQAADAAAEPRAVPRARSA